MDQLRKSSKNSATQKPGSIPYIDFEKLNISFNGCGFLGIYHVGVATALRTYVPNFQLENVCGASAGALAAVCLLGNVPPDIFARSWLEDAAECRNLFGGPFNPNFDVCKRLEDTMMGVLPDNIHEIANGKLHISVTSVYSGDNLLISNFATKLELVNTIIASTFIPIFSGILPMRWRGVPVIDGGFSVNQVVLNPSTLTVSPLSGDAHICPQDNGPDAREITRLYLANAGTNITWKNLGRLTQVLYPPKTKVMSDFMMAGFLDCARFLSQYGIMYRTVSCLTVESHVQPSLQQQQQTEADSTKLPEALSTAVNSFLDRELTSPVCSSEGEDSDRDGKSNSLLRKLTWLLKSIVYYQPAFVATRWSLKITCFFVRTLINVLSDLLLLLSGEDESNKRLQFAVEKFLGFLIGFFGPIIGYDYETVLESDARKKRRGLAKVPLAETDTSYYNYNNNKHLAKFSCNVKVHSYENRTRHLGSMAPRRKSISVHRLESLGGGCEQYDKRRFSMALGSLESLITSRRRTWDEEEANHGAPAARPKHLGDSNDSIMEEEDEVEDDENDSSELLSLQLETFLDERNLMPSSHEEGVRLQSEQLEAAASVPSSRLVSRRGSLAPWLLRSGQQTWNGGSGGRNTGRNTAKQSRRGSQSVQFLNLPPHTPVTGSQQQAFINPQLGVTANDDGSEYNEESETLHNIMLFTRDQESVLKTFYTNEDGELVTVSMFDLGDTNPTVLVSGADGCENGNGDGDRDEELWDQNVLNREEVRVRLEALQDQFEMEERLSSNEDEDESDSDSDYD